MWQPCWYLFSKKDIRNSLWIALHNSNYAQDIRWNGICCRCKSSFYKVNVYLWIQSHIFLASNSNLLHKIMGNSNGSACNSIRFLNNILSSRNSKSKQIVRFKIKRSYFNIHNRSSTNFSIYVQILLFWFMMIFELYLILKLSQLLHLGLLYKYHYYL